MRRYSCGDGPRILVVEDDDGLRDVLARGLRAESFDVVTARDGGSALRAAATDARLDAVVLDIGLPDSDGRDVCQALRTRGLDARACSSPPRETSGIGCPDSRRAATTTSPNRSSSAS